MDSIKKDLKVSLAEKGEIITDNDPLFVVIDLIELWIKTNNQDLVEKLVQKSNSIDQARAREYLQQNKVTLDLINKVPLELSEIQQDQIGDIVENRITLAMNQTAKALHPVWWRDPIVYVAIFSLMLNALALLAFVVLR